MGVERKCTKCNTWNKDEDYCVNCGNVLSPQIIEALREEKREEARKNKAPTKLDIFLDKWKNSRFFLFKALYYILYSIGVIFFSIAGFFAWMAAAPNG